MTDECVYCGRLLTEETGKHRDHLIPASRGGSDCVENCVVACSDCNLSKQNRTPSEWRPTGLPAWIYEMEINLAAKYKIPPRSVKTSDGAGMLVTRSPVCLEVYREPCRSLAEAEVYIGGTWSAKCPRCVDLYRIYRVLNERRRMLHILVQLRDGTLSLDRETTICALARAYGVPVKEYLDLAAQMVVGKSSVRAQLKAAFPWLNVWETM